MFAQAGSGQNISGVIGSSFTAVENLASKFTLEIALHLNTDYSCQGNSSSGITLTAIHATADTERVSFPVFPDGFTGQAECLGDSPMPPCLNASTRAASGAGADKMSLPPPRAVSGTSAYVSFVVLPTTNQTNLEGVASKVISATVLGVRHNTVFSGDATMTYELTVDPLAAIVPSTACAWWDEERQRWSNAGCEYLGRSVDRTLVECQCNHLTSFCILTDANAGERTAPNGLTETEQFSLSMFVYVCVSISIVCFMIVIAVYATVHSLRSQTKTILLNLCSIYTLALALFMASAIGDFEGGVCVGIGASLHFALLSTFFWMLVEGRHLFMTFVNVFKDHRSDEWRQLKVYSGLAYGVPALEVMVLACGWPAAYKRDDGFCFLSKQDGAVWAFFGPALVVIVLNMYVLVMVLRVVWDLSPSPSAHDSTTDEIITKAKRAFKSSMVFGSILGVTWALGLLSLVVPSSLAYHYSFAVFNALGGLWIFGFHLLMDPEVGAAYREQTMACMASVKGKVTRRRDLKGERFFGLRIKEAPSGTVSNTTERMTTPEGPRKHAFRSTPPGSTSSTDSSGMSSTQQEMLSTTPEMRRQNVVGSASTHRIPLHDAQASRAVTSRDGYGTPETPQWTVTMRRQNGAENDGVRQEEDLSRRHTVWDEEDTPVSQRQDRSPGDADRQDEDWSRRHTVWDEADTPDKQRQDRPSGVPPQDQDPVGSTELGNSAPLGGFIRQRSISYDGAIADAEAADHIEPFSAEDTEVTLKPVLKTGDKRSTSYGSAIMAMAQAEGSISLEETYGLPDDRSDSADNYGRGEYLDSSDYAIRPATVLGDDHGVPETEGDYGCPGSKHSESSGTFAPEMRRDTPIRSLPTRATPAYVMAPGYATVIPVRKVNTASVNPLFVPKQPHSI